ncbi:MAG: thiamine-phosphate kinase [Chlorobium sp.]|uniref:thiamine-phosphate kinase n=1 Tax=Chlorobium sp. TaxID=1095 RepID=UPI0025BFEFE2|nr:thiamine-phosphate kinase [Chlorobium sp.]MCF8216704.1 thiamine-phosphate kinase [Chlorobium sp.]MCF8271575.1 thiamine-phosphate kinase [Chlorobium sp.]MCF8287944.1 thiamine-phosphate kinase [Chlorobium sp.]MCF8291489.1 thiamine-phosphate kinase [Chlorobium sp.]MCF8385694.1 thiamine-phosphate kinase [Chlorobium sp.]
MPYKAISDIGEFGLIDRLAKLVEPTLAGTPALVKGIGDDCAVYRISETSLQVATTDLLAEQVHFDLLFSPLRLLGGKCISVNVSDICAMNALPSYALISLAVPSSFTIEMVEELYTGMCLAASEYGLAIAGGDTSLSRSGLVVTVSMTGETSDDRISMRSGAQPGDLICVTGTLGAAAAGLKVLIREKHIMLDHLSGNEPYSMNIMANLEEYRDAIGRQLLPVARLDIIKFFHEKNIVPGAMIDISDGISSDLRHICNSSGTGAIIHESRIPINSQARDIADELQEDVITWALGGGEDYELLFTLPPEFACAIEERKDISVIGEITEKETGILLTDIYGMTINLSDLAGYDHFRR